MSSSHRFPLFACATNFLSSRISNALIEFSAFETHLPKSWFSKQSQPCLQRFAPRSPQVLSQLPPRLVPVFLVRIYPSCNTVPHKCPIRSSHSAPTSCSYRSRNPWTQSRPHIKPIICKACLYCVLTLDACPHRCCRGVGSCDLRLFFLCTAESNTLQFASSAGSDHCWEMVDRT